MAKAIHDNLFFVRQAGLEYGEGQGAIVGFDIESEAQANADERNKRAEEMKLKARYEVKTGS